MKKFGILSLLGAAFIFMPLESANAQFGRASTESRIEQLERDMDTLSRQVYRGEGGENASDSASDSGVADSGAFATGFESRLTALEQQFFDLTGQVERQGHQLRQLQSQMDAAARDYDYRFNRLEGNNLDSSVSMMGDSVDDSGTAAVVSDSTVASPANLDNRAIITDSNEPVMPPVTSGGVLGTITATELEANTNTNVISPATVAVAAPVAPVPVVADNAETLYANAYDMLSAGELDSALAGFEEVLSRYGDHALAENAQYWIGDIYYNKGDYRSAAIAFGQGYQRNSNGRKAPDNLLKMGMSLARLGQNEDACTTFSQLQSTFPDAPSRILRTVANERATLACQ